MSTRRRDRRRANNLSAIGVAGEISVTLGVVGLLFFAWYLGINDWVQGSAQTAAADSVTQQWDSQAETFGKAPAESGGSYTPAEPPVIDAVAEGQAYAVLHVPRFGEGYSRTIGEGIDLPSVLNNPEFGVGRYPDTALLGELGNFVVAGHRTTYGASFGDIGELRVGDRLYVEVEQGWFSYRFRNLEYVWPTAIEVLAPVPHQPDATPTQRILTLTSCHPRFSEAERIIAYAVFETFYPRAGEPPEEIDPTPREDT